MKRMLVLLLIITVLLFTFACQQPELPAYNGDVVDVPSTTESPIPATDTQKPINQPQQVPTETPTPDTSEQPNPTDEEQEDPIIQSMKEKYAGTLDGEFITRQDGNIGMNVAPMVDGGEFCVYSYYDTYLQTTFSCPIQEETDIKPIDGAVVETDIEPFKPYVDKLLPLLTVYLGRGLTDEEMVSFENCVAAAGVGSDIVYVWLNTSEQISLFYDNGNIMMCCQ